MCKVCDNPEGNACPACERDMKEAMQASTDGWWPAMVAPRRSINIASTINEAPTEIEYV